MSTVSGTIALTTNFNQTAANIPGNQAVSLSNGQSAKFAPQASGNAADQINLKYSASLTLAAAPTALDLTTLADVFGNAINFKRVRSITIINKATTDGSTVLLGYATTTANAWTALVSNPGQITIEPSTTANSGIFAMTAPNTSGWLVGSSSKLLELDPGANTIAVDVEITGCVA